MEAPQLMQEVEAMIVRNNRLDQYTCFNMLNQKDEDNIKHTLCRFEAMHNQLLNTKFKKNICMKEVEDRFTYMLYSTFDYTVIAKVNHNETAKDASLICRDVMNEIKGDESSSFILKFI